ncbi:toxin-antitoxin system YwqK family antitoxin [Fusobacterium sp. PH5-44]|uniref:toxin-antitoxin system YwqK family antitoxin n=1 Tax=unclassified Fusobacterium TaxID=2648384 RepID=UPI003D217507
MKKLIFFLLIMIFSTITYSNKKYHSYKVPKNSLIGESQKKFFVDLLNDALKKSQDNTVESFDKVFSAANNSNRVKYRHLQMVEADMIGGILYKDDIPYSGIAYLYYDDNQIDEIMFENGIKNGSFIFYYGDGKIRTIGKYKKGKREGAAFTFYKSSKRYSYLLYKNDFLHGLSTLFYENGNLQKKSYYNNGKLHGEYLEYHENGNIKKKSEFIDGLCQGKSYYYPLDDFCYYVSVYTNGINTGQFEGYDYNNELKFSYGYYENIQHGYDFSYSRINSNTNRLYRVGKHSMGKKDGLFWELDDFWNFMYVEEYKNDLKHGISLLYYPNGNLKEHSFYLNGKKHGTSFLFRENGTLEEKIDYIYDKHHGENNEYHYNGNIKYLREFKNDSIVTLEHYLDDGTLVKKANYKNGEKHGEYTAYNYSDGKLQERSYFENGIVTGESILINYNGSWGDSFSSESWQIKKGNSAAYTNYPLFRLVEYRNDGEYNFRLDYVNSTSYIYYLNENKQGKKISLITYTLMHYFRSPIFITIQENIIWSFIPFAFTAFLIIILKRNKIKDIVHISKKNLFIHYTLSFKLFDNFNYINTNSISIIEKGENILYKYMIANNSVKNNLTNIFTDKFLENILKIKNIILNDDIKINIKHYINSKNIENTLMCLENIEQKPYYPSVKKLIIISIIYSGFIYATIITSIWGTLRILIFNILFLIILFLSVIYRLQLSVVKEQISFDFLLCKISNLFLDEILKISNLKFDFKKISLIKRVKNLTEK